MKIFGWIVFFVLTLAVWAVWPLYGWMGFIAAMLGALYLCNQRWGSGASRKGASS